MAKNIDTIILGLTVLLVIKGIWRGFKKELSSLLTYGTAYLITMSQLENGTAFFQNTFGLHPILGYFVAYFAVFFISFFVLKFFVKNLMKLISKEPTSGLADSIAGGTLGFCLAMIIVGMLTTMLKPIPVMDSVFAQKDKTLFLPFSEKYAEPIVQKFMPSASTNPLDQMLSKGLSENLILPDMMKGLMGDGMGSLMENISTDDLNLDDPKIQEALKQAQQGEDGTGAAPKPRTGLGQAYQLLDVDTSAANKKSIKDLLKIIK
ncbi:CvpA family protein [candidate division KSB1 bacterium]